MSNEPTKWGCMECSWHGVQSDLLTAPSPFEPMDIISGCPECLFSGGLVLLCEKPGCFEAATHTGPTQTDYGFTCPSHVPAKWAEVWRPLQRFSLADQGD